jgi:hypothetical protein
MSGTAGKTLIPFKIRDLGILRTHRVRIIYSTRLRRLKRTEYFNGGNDHAPFTMAKRSLKNFVLQIVKTFRGMEEKVVYPFVQA